MLTETITNTYTLSSGYSALDVAGAMAMVLACVGLFWLHFWLIVCKLPLPWGRR